MGVVKYSGPIASFHCPTEATIRSLKVHFSPKQLGSGTPSPENVREIVGWDGVEVQQTRKNLWGNKFAADEIYAEYKKLFPTGDVVRYEEDNNGKYLCIESAYKFNTTNIAPSFKPKTNTVYTIIFSGELLSSSLLSSNITVNYTDGTAGFPYFTKGSEKELVVFKTAIGKTIDYIGCRFLYNTTKIYYEDKFGIFEGDIDISEYEPYHGTTTNYEFGVLGKNKFNWNVPVSESSPVGSDAATAREFTLGTYVIGMSVNNYYRQNYSNWVLNPSVENGVISFSSGGASGYGIAFPLKLAAGQTYFLSGTGNGSTGATYYDENGELISYQNGRLNKTITVPENAAITLIGFYASASNTEFSFSNIQLELGSTATAYEPYDPKHTVYGGWVDLISGEVCEEYYKITLTQNDVIYSIENLSNDSLSPVLKVQYANHNGATIINAKILDALLMADQKEKEIKSKYTHGEYLLSSTEVSYHGLVVSNRSQTASFALIFIPCAPTVQDVKNYLASQYDNGTPVEICYELATPHTYQLPPVSVNLKTFLSQNNIWSNADYVEVEYDLHETQNILARKQFIIANQPHVEKLAAAPLQSFETDMAAPLKECKVEFKPVQEGTGAPSPDNVREIKGWNEINLQKSGKNIFNPKINPVWNGGAYTRLEDGGVQISGSDGRGWTSNQIVPLSLKQGTYTFTWIGSKRVQFATSEDNYATVTTYSVSNLTSYKSFNFTLSTDGAIKWKHTADTDDYPITVYVQIEPTDVGTSYESYNGIITPINWQNDIGTIYGGYVDLVKGELVQEYGSQILNGTEGWIRQSQNQSNPNSQYNPIYLTATNLKMPMTDFFQKGITNYIPEYTASTNLTYNGILCCRFGWGDSSFYLCNVEQFITDITNITTLKQYLSEHPLTIIYKLKEPIIHQLTPTQLKTLRGTNNIWSNANGNIELSYWKH